MRHFAPLTLLFALAACGDDGVAPTISALTFSPSTAPVGQQTTVSGTLQFEDADGDLDAVGLEIVLPSGDRQASPHSPIQGAGGVKAGPVSWAIFLTPPSPGTYTLELFVVDEADHESNRLTAAITAP